MASSRMPAWLAGTMLVISMTNVQGASITRSSAFEYDPATGLLTKEIVEPDNPQLRLETTYTYDAYGNKTAVTVSSPATGSAAVEARTSTTTYDSRGQFPISSANALGQSETRVFDPNFGAIKSLTGPNGLTTQWQYDSFGRKTLEIRADGTRTQWSYQYCNGVYTGTAACPSLAKYLVQTTSLAADGITQNGPISKTYYDALDRVIRTETQGFNGALIYQDTQYDSRGRVERTSRPYYSNQTPQWTVVTYDSIDRPIATTLPDGTRTTVVYSGFITRTTNALGQTQVAQKNSQGKVIKVTDAANNSITYQYDALGNLTTTTDPQGNVVRLTYDVRGRKTQMVDPDMGTWTYDYDVLGQLIKQTDAKGQISTIAYDKLGRTTRRNEADLVSTWTYDNCTNGIGKPCTSTADNGYASTVRYDSYGRPIGNTTTIDTTYTSSVSYDANGRIATQTWPTGLAVKYIYNNLGYLTEVRNNADNSLYWQANSMDAQGHLLQQSYGNGVITQQVFDSLTNRIKNIYAGAGNGVQNLSYSYDNGGNMLSRNDANQNLVETFGYDSINRLTSATVNSAGAGLVTTTYAYDSLGNITNRSDMGAYTYGPVNNRPHGLKEVAFLHGGKLQYTYDANGALIAEVAIDSTGAVITDRGRTETYTSYGMLQTISSPQVNLSFAYGPDHQRVKQIAPSATTIYLHPDNAGGLAYEKDIKADGSIEHRHFLTAGGSVFALIKQIATPTGTTTKTLYMHRDHLGSTTAITDEQGNVIERLAYEPFGKRRYPAGNTDDGGELAGINTDRGYTNHEHLDELGLIHMNGRVYDPALGRFLSADPNIQSPYDTQSYNRYAYVINNPLIYTDPTGYLFGGMFKVPFIDNLWNNHIKQYGQQIVSVVAVAACTYFTAGSGTAACVGASQAAVSKAYGADWNTAIRAGVVAGATAYGYQWAGGSIARSALVGCASAVAGGGNCGSGALAAGFSAAYGNYVGYSSNTIYATIQSAAVGGTASVLGGGKFENGAVTGAFRYLLGRAIDSSQRLQAINVVSPQVVDGPPGASMWAIRWQLDQPSEKGGYIAQEMIIDAIAVDENGSQILDRHVHYWEAWRVEPGSTTATPAADRGINDVYNFDGKPGSVSGEVVWQGSARFYENLELPSSFVVGGASNARDLLSTTQNPWLPLSRATPAVTREFRVKWPPPGN